jgi:hypothetical protein
VLQERLIIDWKCRPTLSRHMTTTRTSPTSRGSGLKLLGLGLLVLLVMAAPAAAQIPAVGPCTADTNCFDDNPCAADRCSLTTHLCEYPAQNEGQDWRGSGGFCDNNSASASHPERPKQRAPCVGRAPATAILPTSATVRPSRDPRLHREEGRHYHFWVAAVRPPRGPSRAPPRSRPRMHAEPGICVERVRAITRGRPLALRGLRWRCRH